MPGKTAKTLYDNLMLPRHATTEEIVARVRRARTQCHPDMISRTQPLHAEFANTLRNIIDETAEILLNTEHRKVYDYLITKTKALPLKHGGAKTPFLKIKDLISLALEHKAPSGKRKKSSTGEKKKSNASKKSSNKV